MDHVLPKDRGGETSWENVVTSCIRCNSKKSNRLPREAGMRLLNRPKRPARRPLSVPYMVDQSKKPGAFFTG